LNYYDEFRRELRELGYVEGQHIVIDYRFADGKFDRLPQLAAELVQLDVGWWSNDLRATLCGI
jgi:putative tryptophan/tyrosine transport system substrate-binding protein